MEALQLEKLREELITLLKSKPQNEFMSIEGKSYTRQEIIKEFENATSFSHKLIAKLLIHTIDQIQRGKIVG